MRSRDVVTRERRVHQADLELRWLGVGEERSVIGVGVHPHPEDLAVVAQRHLALEVHVATKPGRDQVAGLVLDPLDRALEQDRRQDRRDVAGVHRDFVAEATTEVGGDDPDHVLGNLGNQRDRCADDVWSLRSHVDGQLRGGPIEVGDRPARLDRRRMRPRVVHLDLGHDVGLGEGPVGAVLVADLPVEDHVVVLVDLVVADQRRVGRHRLLRVDDRGQRLVVDDDRLARRPWRCRDRRR